MGNDIARPVYTPPPPPKPPKKTPLEIYNNSKKTYLAEKKKLWKDEINYNVSIGNTNFQKEWSENKLNLLNKQWNNILLGWKNYRNILNEFNYLLSDYSKDYEDQILIVDEQINLLKKDIENNKNKVNKIDRNSYLHLENYKDKLKLFHKCKKILIFLLLVCIILNILHVIINKYKK